MINLYYLISINKFISYILCNKGIIVNLYKLHFPSSSFSLQPNKKVFHPPNFPLPQPNTQEGKLNIFHPPTIFHPPIFSLLQPNKALKKTRSKVKLVCSIFEVITRLLNIFFFISNGAFVHEAFCLMFRLNQTK